VSGNGDNGVATGGSAPANRGGGGGGGGWSGPFFNGGNGGSGVVILSYPDSFFITIGAGLTASTTTVSGNKVTTITAGTGNVSWTA
jgi:hypothetical protein